MDVQNNVITKMVAQTSQFVSPMNAVSSSLESVQRGIISTLTSLNPLTAALGALAGGVTAGRIAQIGSEFENTKNQIAGAFTALGYSDNFNAGLQLADDTLTRINAKAAALPGEAEDYMNVFRMTLPNVNAAVGGTMDNMLEFTNKLTAITSTFGIFSQQAAMDLNRMLQAGHGGAGMDVRTFQELLPYMKSVEGQANLTADAFNKMNQTQRAHLLEQTFSKLDPMINNAASSWDAMEGAFTSGMKQITRLATAPIFDAMKTQLGGINAQLLDANGQAVGIGAKMVEAGQAISTYLVTGLGKAIEFGTQLYDSVRMVGTFITANPWVQALVQAAEGGGGSIMSMLSMGADTLMQALSAIAPYLDTVFTNAVQIATSVIDNLSGIINTSMVIFAMMRPYVMRFISSVGNLVDSIMSFLEPAIRIVGGVFNDLWAWIGPKLIPVMAELWDWLTNLVNKIADVFRFLGRVLDQAATMLGYGRRLPQGATSPAQQAVIQHAAAAAASANVHGAPRTPPAQRGGAKVNQDFRGSRFDITQKFQEGYDPDRVAVVFREDLERAGQQRTQSGFGPMFGV